MSDGMRPDPKPCCGGLSKHTQSCNGSGRVLRSKGPVLYTVEDKAKIDALVAENKELRARYNKAYELGILASTTLTHLSDVMLRYQRMARQRFKSLTISRNTWEHSTTVWFDRLNEEVMQHRELRSNYNKLQRKEKDIRVELAALERFAVFFGLEAHDAEGLDCNFGCNGNVVDQAWAALQAYRELTSK